MLFRSPEPFTGTTFLESTQPGPRAGPGSPPEAMCVPELPSDWQVLEISSTVMWYSVSMPEAERGGAQRRVTVVGVTPDTLRNRGTPGTAGEDPGEKKTQVHLTSYSTAE